MVVGVKLNFKNKIMKHISIISLITIFLMVGCMQPEEVDIEVVPNLANITEVSVGVMSTTGAFSAFPLTLEEIDVNNHTVKVYVSTFSSTENIWASAKLEEGCSIKPINGAPVFGSVGDFTSGTYRVTAASGDTADWEVSIEQDPNMPDISCLANFWSGEGVTVTDMVFPSYSPSTVVAEQIDCNHVTITFEFWGSSTPPMVFELELGEPDSVTFVGSVTLLNDVETNSYGYDVKFSAGSAGTYDLNTFSINLDPVFEGYGSYTSYPFKITKD